MRGKLARCVFAGAMLLMVIAVFTPVVGAAARTAAKRQGQITPYSTYCSTTVWQTVETAFVQFSNAGGTTSKWVYLQSLKDSHDTSVWCGKVRTELYWIQSGCSNMYAAVEQSGAGYVSQWLYGYTCEYSKTLYTAAWSATAATRAVTWDPGYGSIAYAATGWYNP